MLDVKGNPDKDNFFRENLHAKDLPYVDDLYEEYGEDKASDIMWAIHRSEKPSSVYYNLGKAERLDMIAKKFLNEDNFDWEPFEKIIDKYPYYFLSKEKREFKIWADKFEEANRMIREEQVDNKNVDKILGRLSKVESVFESFEKVKKKFLEADEREKQTKGDKKIGKFAQRRKARPKSKE